MTAVKKDLYIEQGTTFVLPFQWCTAGVDAVTPGPPRDLTGWQVRMQVRKSQGEPVQINATTTNGKIVLGWDPNNLATDPTALPAGTPDPANGWITVYLTDDDTDLLNTKTGKYDLEAESPAGRVYRLLQGVVTVDPNITQESDDVVVA